jgi:hypothetical protein
MSEAESPSLENLRNRYERVGKGGGAGRALKRPSRSAFLAADSVPPPTPPWAGILGGFPPPKGSGGGGPTPSFPILTEEVGYPPSPLANTSSAQSRPASTGRGSALGPTVTRALQDVLGWKIKTDDPKGFVGALNQSFQLKMVEGAVVSTWTPRSYAVQTDLSGGITGAQASIYTMAKTLTDQALPLIDGLYALDPAADMEDVAALKDLVTSQLTNLTAEVGYLGGPRVMRANQYFQMLLGATLTVNLSTTPVGLTLASGTPASGSPLALAFPASGDWPPSPPFPTTPWVDPDLVLGSLGDLRDQLGLFSTPVAAGPGDTPPTVYVNTVADEQNVTNFRIIVDYVNSLLNAWQTSIQFFAGTTSPFLGTQLVVISRQLGVITETVDEVRFVLDSVFIGPAQRQTTQIVFHTIPSAPASVLALPPIYLEDLLMWTETFVGQEAQDAIQNGGKLGLGEDFVAMIQQLTTQAFGVYLFAQSQLGTAIGTVRVQQSLAKLATQLWDLVQFAAPVGVQYVPPRP